MIAIVHSIIFTSSTRASSERRSMDNDAGRYCIIKRLKYIFTNKILFSLYNSLVIPYIQYDLLLWGSKYSNVEKLQKRAIRLATGSHYIKFGNEVIRNKAAFLKINPLSETRRFVI